MKATMSSNVHELKKSQKLKENKINEQDWTILYQRKSEELHKCFASIDIDDYKTAIGPEWYQQIEQLSWKILTNQPKIKSMTIMYLIVIRSGVDKSFKLQRLGSVELIMLEHYFLI